MQQFRRMSSGRVVPLAFGRRLDDQWPTGLFTRLDLPCSGAATIALHMHGCSLFARAAMLISIVLQPLLDSASSLHLCLRSCCSSLPLGCTPAFSAAIVCAGTRPAVRLRPAQVPRVASLPIGNVRQRRSTQEVQGPPQAWQAPRRSLELTVQLPPVQDGNSAAGSQHSPGAQSGSACAACHAAGFTFHHCACLTWSCQD